MPEKDFHSRNIVACVWDFDKTLISSFMQEPLFRRYGIDENDFWDEVNALPKLYEKRGLSVSADTVYLNHLLTYVRSGPLKGLNNGILRELGADLQLLPGLPRFFQDLKERVASRPEYRKHEITLEHYIISTGLAEMIRGCAIAPCVDGIWGCEFVENPAPPHFNRQGELPLETDREIRQIGVMVDNTIKTRFIFVINKGANKHPEIDVNASMRPEDRRIPIRNMIYVADGPSDVPVFSVVKGNGGRTYAVYNPDSPKEFEQNDRLLQSGRIHAYGPADYRPESSTARWIEMHVEKICDRIVEERELSLSSRITRPPRHLHKETAAAPPPASSEPTQETFLEKPE
jgi:hypothetical protein